ncbi:formate/nitrite transporter family protein [Aquimarina sp. MMG016]|uniref:formate/nitrite transporter family protein n=1 Tax=Aquimarina sp. MMG016 TaxID=2822690 RepID=UPI001B3A65EC|nr:formate/nitrite transporter family protein [Aquimarina sp. MMG016]MBQ4820532.1 formate/nitrite transporter family protein [Aquimarina sp. MMG016]
MVENQNLKINENTNGEAQENSPMSHSEILREQVSEALVIYDKTNSSILLSSLSAGLEIGFSFLLICVMTAFFINETNSAIIWKINALVYPVGFILVVLGKSMLFTEQTSLLTLPVLNKKSKVIDLFRLWGLVLTGNIFGGILISIIAIWIGPKLGIFDVKIVEKVSQHVLHSDLTVIFVSAILAGWLMGLLSWLLTSSDSTISRILVIYIITAVIGAMGLHHSIVGNIEVFSGLIVSKKITITDYLSFQGVAIIGNAIGGVVFVALLKYKAFAYNGNN